ncbi:cytochrome c subunit [Trichophyton equinum CBS 127.97]|uniref:Cytochrome c oxidase subunit 8, mitochondrial n=1 Tax=Trichophyton equinum (strain ATCC MYA-4606 / CBS 127.97) TaxID=559882 RepID=F2PMK5_TRIEC|nr:cytochrome c subunit [Trichophyton equinum CBS 127.97]
MEDGKKKYIGLNFLRHRLTSASRDAAELCLFLAKSFDAFEARQHLLLTFSERRTTPAPPTVKMFARSAIRANTAASIISRRGFHSTRTQLASGFHYPEGPRSNIPFNPLTKFFFVRYWAFMFTGFTLPFAIAVWQTKKSR